jgi:hypothetical protein
MHTQYQVVLQSGAVIPAIAKLEKKRKDTNGAAAENDIWCPGALRVVIQDGTGEGAQRDRSVD